MNEAISKMIFHVTSQNESKVESLNNNCGKKKENVHRGKINGAYMGLRKNFCRLAINHSRDVVSRLTKM